MFIKQNKIKKMQSQNNLSGAGEIKNFIYNELMCFTQAEYNKFKNDLWWKIGGYYDYEYFTHTSGRKIVNILFDQERADFKGRFRAIVSKKDLGKLISVRLICKNTERIVEVRSIDEVVRLIDSEYNICKNKL